MSKEAGYTEAERLALEWSKKNKKPAERPPERERVYERRSNSGQSRDNRYIDRRSSDSHSNWNRRDDSRDRDRDRDRYSRTDRRPNERYDEFGRIVSSRSYGDSQSSSSGNRRDRSRSRCRSRSRSRSPVRRRPYEDEIREKRVQESEQSEKQRRIDTSWTHDKFDHDDTGNRPRRVDADYQPPAPKWISKAGGVAIINRSV